MSDGKVGSTTATACTFCGKSCPPIPEDQQIPTGEGVKRYCGRACIEADLPPGHKLVDIADMQPGELEKGLAEVGLEMVKPS